MSVSTSATTPVLWLGFGAAILVVILECAYAIILALGLSALETPNDPISDPFFTIMELLIIMMMPTFVILTIAVHTICQSQRRHHALAAIVFVTMLTTITTAVHASILLLSREAAFVDMKHVFSFEWHSVAYVLDVMAWDFFFGFFAIFLGLSFERTGLEWWIRVLLILSGVLALAGLLGASTGNMDIRNIGIVGYVGVFTISSALMASLMWRRLRLA
ncbi:hypothetical protein KUL25_04605 [Rhodobacteraceae bacterium N5(2021)]|uniref:Uncharacterized protein n=1 Tax=Gymnodinialimonas phycosphaerae TaxID=2841589 RepID=A0A975TW70_9RHOB|nr:hypothetical protein [Gymnodinialimonas phycosphaerae]MBY4892040.1 hypothetical protein [Gymnodinialimonas phycosphaerae]